MTGVRVPAPASAKGASVVARRIAVMQPYLFPYPGYFRLLTQADEFVLYDCVQFPRRGRVHRCEVGGEASRRAWLGLPLAPQPRDVAIRDLAFAAGARAAWEDRLRALPWIAGARGETAEALRDVLHGPLGDVVDFIEATLRRVLALAARDARIVRSSTLDIDPGLRGQARILAIAAARGATHYLNAPGGRALYSPAAFADAGVSLEFLPPYAGAFPLLLPALFSPRAQAALDEIAAGDGDRTNEAAGEGLLARPETGPDAGDAA